MNAWKFAGSALLATAVLTIGGGATVAQEERALGWSDTAELSYVFTAGNSESSSLGFKNTALRLWPESELEIKVGGIQVETTRFLRYAVGPDPGGAVVTELESTDTTAEAYFLNGRYRRDISPKLFWFAGAGWDRNVPAGIDNRYLVEGGLGNVWRDDERVKFRTDYALTYTKQEDVVESPGVDDTFLGARFVWKYEHKFTDSTTYGNDLVLDANLEESSDWRADMLNWLSVTMTKRMALKVGLRWLYDHSPALGSIPLYDLPPTDPLAAQIGTVPYELEELDTIFTTSLVLSF